MKKVHTDKEGMQFYVAKHYPNCHLVTLKDKPTIFESLGGPEGPKVYVYDDEILGVSTKEIQHPRLCDLEEPPTPTKKRRRLDPAPDPAPVPQALGLRRGSPLKGLGGVEPERVGQHRGEVYNTLDNILECGSCTFLETPFKEGTQRDEIPMIGRDKFETLMQSYHYFCKRGQITRLLYELPHIRPESLSNEEMDQLEVCVRVTWERLMKNKMKRLT